VEDLSIPELLGTPHGIQALANFITASGAFSKTGLRRSNTQAEEDME
jgi:hypothetical protein